MKRFNMPIILWSWGLVILLFSGCAVTDKPGADKHSREDPIIKDYFYLGLRYYKQGEYDKAAAEYSRALVANPDFAMAYYYRGAAYSHKGQYDKTISDYTEAVEIDPKLAAAFYNRGTIYTEDDHIEIDPKLADAYFNRGNSYYDNGHNDKAISDFTKAIAIDPKNATVYIKRGHAYREEGLYPEAISDFTRIIEIIPDDAHAYNEKAWVLATCSDARYRDGDKAVALAQKAVDISPKPVYLDTLGAAYAEAGNFEKAIATQEQVIAQIKETGADKELVDKYTERLKYYEARKPWREIR